MEYSGKNENTTEQESKKEKFEKGKTLKEVKDRYMSSFTIHALNHIVEGSLPEKVLWTFKLLLALGVAVYLAWNIFVAYFDYEVSTTIKCVSMSSMRLPMVYICGEGYNHNLMLNLHNCLKGNESFNRRVCTALHQEKPDW